MFEEKLKIYKDSINFKLGEILAKLKNKDCSYVFDAINYSLVSGGKLLRPILTLAVCEMFSKNFKVALNFAAAVEFMHVGSLVHDDLPCMDDDSKRRGKDACHVKFNECAAVLAGDAFFCSAFEILTYSKEDGLLSEDILKAVFLLSRMFGTKGTIAGQNMDMFLEFKKENFELIEKIAEYKTCCLIKAACGLGAIAAKANKNQIDLLNKYSYNLGIFFQICDDVKDYEKNSSNENKLTFVSVYGLKKAKEKAKEYYNYSLEILNKFENSEFLKELTRFIFKKVS